MAQLRVNNARRHQVEVKPGWQTLQIEKVAQFVGVGRDVVKPRFILDQAKIAAARIAEKIGRIGKPAGFADRWVEPVAGLQRAGNLGRIAQAEDDLGRQLQLVRDLMPERHQAHRTRVLEAEIRIAHAVSDERGDFAAQLDNARVRPPCDGEAEIVRRPEIGAVQEREDAIVQIDDFPALPMSLWIVWIWRSAIPQSVRHVDPESAQHMRAQGCAAAVHADNHDDRAALRRARHRCDRAGPRHLPQQRGRRDRSVIHSATPGPICPWIALQRRRFVAGLTTRVKSTDPARGGCLSATTSDRLARPALWPFPRVSAQPDAARSEERQPRMRYRATAAGDPRVYVSGAALMIRANGACDRFRRGAGDYDARAATSVLVLVLSVSIKPLMP